MSPVSRPPPGVPSSGGNAKYAIVATVLVVGVVAVVALRTCSPPPTAPAPMPSVSVAQSAAPPNPKLEDIPPPPPIEEKPEAGPAPRIVYVPAGGCDSKCSGSAPPELAQALQVRGSQARRCYNQALAQDPTLKGHVSIGVRIGPTGNVCSATVTSNDMGTPAVANCAANILRSNAYPAPRGGCVEYNVPLSFVTQGQ